MPSAMVSQTVQGAVLSATSNILAQVITSYKENTPFSLNIGPVIKFAVFSVVSNPPNIVWQGILENAFPTNVPASPAAPSEKTLKDKLVETQMSKRNVLIKFIFDQTFGAVLNTLMFLVFMGYVNEPGAMAGKVEPMQAVVKEINEKFWPMILDGYKFWPIVSLLSFMWVPVDQRVVFGCSVGVLWGIYLSLVADS
ncbi:hypothetical protein K458DRAFT_475040 [Lentithecium fluviatile CBS 122367]|uniref:Integral membrane protein-like protein n=1 Tax=Lentithecium fluviatile CBS 122367 TaxID=1168545 RepID=A0A6G1JGB3_9PLEO|nr:hypothetical protein K458DRAFT_475040 [Lentithecium fluviatile CBS 122367]